MKLIEQYPEDGLVGRYVERYQLYRIEEPAYLKTIPNAKLECWFIMGGGFEIFDTEKQRFVSAQRTGGYPATNSPLLFYISDALYVLNVKFKLSALAFKEFSNLYPARLDADTSSIFPESFTSGFYHLSSQQGGLQTAQLDDWLRPLFHELTLHEPSIIQFIEGIEQGGTLSHLLEKLSLSPKTLERWSKIYFGLPPKKLLQIQKFDKATQYAKGDEFGKLIDLIGFGYYDQSHFIRECKRITGLPPKEFFNKLSLSTNDLMVGKKKL